MPLFGTTTDVTSLEQLQTLDAESRLSLQKRDGKNVLVTTKGTLADGLYSFWAKCRPNQARQARLDTLNYVRDSISKPYGEGAVSLFDSFRLDKSQSSSYLTSPLMRSELKVFFENLIKPTNLEIRDLVEGITGTCTVEDLEWSIVLYQNQSSSLPSKDKPDSKFIINYLKLRDLILEHKKSLKNLSISDKIFKKKFQVFNENLENFLKQKINTSEHDLELFLSKQEFHYLTT